MLDLQSQTESKKPADCSHKKTKPEPPFRGSPEPLLIEKGKTSQLVTNCQLNWLMIYLDTLKLGYNPYVASFSQLVRQGKASRRKWLLLMELADTGVGMGLYMKFWRRKEMKYVLKYLDLELDDLYRAAKSKIH